MDRLDEAGIIIRPTVKLESEMDIKNKEDIADLVRLLRYMPKSHESAAADLIENMLAENSRLQSVIDEGNAQEPVGYVDNYTLGMLALRKGHQAHIFDSAVSGKIALYARPIPAQKIEIGDGAVDSFEKFAATFDHESSAWLDMDAQQTFTSGYNRGFLAGRLFAKQSPAVAVPDEETNFCALKSIKDSEVAKVARAFWRRIYPYRNDFGIELPHPLPVEFMAHMATALTWVDREPSPRITEQDAREIIEHFIGKYSIHGYAPYVDGWMMRHCRALLNKLNDKRLTDKDLERAKQNLDYFDAEIAPSLKA